MTEQNTKSERVKKLLTRLENLQDEIKGYEDRFGPALKSYEALKAEYDAVLDLYSQEVLCAD